MKTTAGNLGAIILLTASTPLTFGQNTLQFTDVVRTDDQAIRLAWTTQSNHMYQIQCADQIGTNSDATTTWQVLYDNYPSQGSNTFWLDTGNYFKTPAILAPRKKPTRFYRILDKGIDVLAADEPVVSILYPTNGSVLAGLVTVAVTATTDQGVVYHKLYVDGQEMWPSADGTNYVINTCEWGNGLHVLFATASSATAVDGPFYSYSLSGHAVSAFVPVTFSNLVTKISFSEPFFKPDSGQTQEVSAVFAANCDWTLEIKDIYSNTVRTATGSGTSMLFNWDGNGDGGTNIPNGVYYYYISAQTNGQSSGLANYYTAGLSSGFLGVPEAGTELWAFPSDNSGDACPLVLYPPGTDTNDLTIFETSPAENRFQSAVTSLAGSDNLGLATAAFSLDGSASAPSQASPPAPAKPPTDPNKGPAGKIGVAYQMYQANGTNPVYASPIIDNNYGTRTFVTLSNVFGYGGTSSLPFPPFHNVDSLAFNFISAMGKGSWELGFIKHDDEVRLSDLRGSGGIFNAVDIGILLTHCTFGLSFDSTPGASVKQMYFPITSGTGAQYLRMSEFSLGGATPTNGLKWMALMGCFSLYQPNWNSMKSQGVKPYNSNLHMILGTATMFGADPLIGQYWADYMRGDPNAKPSPRAPMKIREAWYEAAKQAYIVGSAHTTVYPNPTVFAVVADGNCTEDSLQTNSTPSGGTWTYYNSKQVFPPQ